jgi:RNA polymerase sigma-70 factor (ECF subfamily)
MDRLARLQWLQHHIVPYEATVRGWLYRHVRSLSKADADDLVQEAYSRLWLLDFDAITSPHAYFVTIVRNLLGEQARRAKIVPMERMGELEALTIISEEPGPERIVSARDELEQLLEIVDTLPPQCRRAFELRKIEGLSIHEAALALGVTDGAVEKLLSRALAKVLDALGAATAEASSKTRQPYDRSGTPIDQ